MKTYLILPDYASNRQKAGIVMSLAVPAMFENILQTTVGFVDTLFVSKLGLIQVSAVGVANTVLSVYIAIFMAIGVGASSLIGQSIGAGDIERARSIVKQSTLISLIAGLLFGIITLFFAEPLLGLMGAELKILSYGVTYFRIVAVPSVFISLMFVFGSILRASGDTMAPMKVGLWINLIHIGSDYLLIFGLGNFAGLGVIGAAWATVIVRVIGTIALFYKINKSKTFFKSFNMEVFSEFKYLRPLLKLSTPAALDRLIMRLGQVLYLSLIVRIGTGTYAAHIIAGNIETFSYMPCYGLALAATTLVGQNIGAKKIEDAHCYGILTAFIAAIFMLFVGIIFFVFSPWFATWFTTEQEVINMVVAALRIDAFAQPALAVGLVMAGALQGAGDTKSPMYSTVIGMWLVRVTGVYILGVKLEMGITGIWLAILTDLFIRAIYLSYRFLTTRREAPFPNKAKGGLVTRAG